MRSEIKRGLREPRISFTAFIKAYAIHHFSAGLSQSLARNPRNALTFAGGRWRGG
jgi:hypothetical protein